MPAALRGIDAITFATFQALDLKVTVRPVLCGDPEDDLPGHIRYFRDMESYEYFERPKFELESDRVGDAFHELKYDNLDRCNLKILGFVFCPKWEDLNKVCRSDSTSIQFRP